MNSYYCHIFLIVSLLLSITAQPVEGMSYLKVLYAKANGACAAIQNYFYPSIIPAVSSSSAQQSETDITNKVNDKKEQLLKSLENITVDFLFLGDSLDENNQLEAIYWLSLKEIAPECDVASAHIFFNKVTKKARINSIVVKSNKRQYSYGTLLLQAIGISLQQLGCTRATGFANPFDLRKGENCDQMLPKLLAFYKRNGIEVDDKNNLVFTFPGNLQGDDKDEKSPALTLQPVNGVENIDNYAKAAQRLEMVTNHLVPENGHNDNGIHEAAARRLNILAGHLTR